ncbi:MAG: heterodisulfide reductase-related iron-sulfur binding cluster [Anaerolineae bacterium]|nr:heterodisulfide reductase-related iron-sulfur binding cluster [Anaerolineae bacterium]
MTTMLQTALAQEIRDRSGENVFLCYQCKKCTAGCPVAAYFDLTPHQVLRACQFGLTDMVLNSRTISICAACETCSTRCPQGIDIARIMDVLEIMAAEKGIKSKAPTVPMFYKSANRGIDLFGRMWELGLMAELYLRELLAGKFDVKQLVKYDLEMALKMFRGGKLKLLPSVARRRRNGHRPAKAAEVIALPADAGASNGENPLADGGVVSYYPGCSLEATGIEFHMSTEAIAEKLGLKLVEPEGWVCCGTSPAHNTDHYRSIKLPMKTLAIADEMGHRYMTMPCAACFSRFRIAMKEVEEDPELRQRITDDIGFDYKGGIQVDNLLTTITEKVGYEAAARPVVRKLKGLKVACYYGCLLTRPPSVTGEERYEYPMNMDHLMEALGAEAVDWSYKTDCCGGSLSLSTLDIALDLSHKILRNAIECGAEMIVTACPLCHVNLDARQKQINAEFGGTFDIPIVYFTQMMGVAYGLHAKPLGLDKHLSDAISLLKAKRLLFA